MGIWEFAGMGYHVDDVQMMRTDKLQMMMSHRSCYDFMCKNGNDEQCFWILQSNSGAYGGPETG